MARSTARAPVPARVIRDPAGWFSEGKEKKRAARLGRRCVECARELPSRRTPYCSRSCRWRFAGHYFWDAARTYVIHRDRFTCQVCRRRFRVAQLEVDHRLEIARGGPSLEYENLQTICKACHREKTGRFLRTRPDRGAPPGAAPGVGDGIAAPGWNLPWYPGD